MTIVFTLLSGIVIGALLMLVALSICGVLKRENKDEVNSPIADIASNAEPGDVCQPDEAEQPKKMCNAPKPCVRINKDGSKSQYPSLSDAARDSHTTPRAIRKCIEGEFQQAGGYKWQWTE